MSKILSRLNFTPVSHTSEQAIYQSPFSKNVNERFTITIASNTWSDSMLRSSGKPIDFVCAWLGHRGENNTVPDAKRWLKNIVLAPRNINLSPFPDFTAEEDKYQIRGVLPLMHFLLVRYVESRCIPREIAMDYLREVRVYNTATKKVFRALGIRNEDGGYFIRNSRLKANIQPATISFIRGEDAKPNAVHIFKDIFDFLSAVTYGEGKPFRHDSIILNAWSCLNDVFPYIKNYGYEKVYTWLDNSDLGSIATNALDAQFRTEEGLRHISMNGMYEGHKDPNVWLMATQLHITQ